MCVEGSLFSCMHREVMTAALTLSEISVSNDAYSSTWLSAYSFKSCADRCDYCSRGEIYMITQFPGVIFTFKKLKCEYVLRYHHSGDMHRGLWAAVLRCQHALRYHPSGGMHRGLWATVLRCQHALRHHPSGGMHRGLLAAVLRCQHALRYHPSGGMHKGL